jgi:hypothetical protein
MKSRCSKEELLKHIKAQIRREYESQVEAAADLGQTKQNLSAALNGKTKDIPEWLAERFGYRKTVVYERVNVELKRCVTQVIKTQISRQSL